MSALEDAFAAQLSDLLPEMFVDPPQAEPWMDDARCAEGDPEAFFPEKGGSTRDAKALCTVCTVAEQCLLFALANDERFGIWGGKSERERRKLRKGRPPAEPRTVQPGAKTWRGWSEQELADLTRWNGEGLTDTEIGRRLSRHQSTVSEKRRALGLPAQATWGGPRG